jgi:hypothetical protein
VEGGVAGSNFEVEVAAAFGPFIFVLFGEDRADEADQRVAVRGRRRCGGGFLGLAVRWGLLDQILAPQILAPQFLRDGGECRYVDADAFPGRKQMVLTEMVSMTGSARLRPSRGARAAG